MIKPIRILLAVLFLALGFLAFFLAANGGYHIASPNVLGIIGLVCVVIAAGLVGLQARIRR